MAKTGRLIVAVLAGAALWAVLWIAGTRGAQAALPATVVPDEPLAHVGVLVAFIAYSAVLSAMAGYLTAAAAGARPMPAVWVLAGLQLTLGIVAEASYWSLMPVWYHLVFLALLVPATVWGGVLHSRRREMPTSAPA